MCKFTVAEEKLGKATVAKGRSEFLCSTVNKEGNYSFFPLTLHMPQISPIGSYRIVG